MSSKSRYDDAVRRAAGLLAADYDENYVSQKLSKEDFSAEEIKAILTDVKYKGKPPQAAPQTNHDSLATNSAAEATLSEIQIRANELSLNLFSAGHDNDYIYGRLIKAGFSKTDALTALNSLPKNYSRNSRIRGGDSAKQILFGFVVMTIGCGVTFFTFRDAVNNGGGTYVVAWGLILVGGFRLVAGLMDMK